MKTRTMIMGFLALCAVTGLAPGQAQAAGRNYDDYCREYTRTVYIGNRQQEAYGTACLQPNGDWKIVDEDDGRRIGQTFRSENMPTNYPPVYQPRYQTAPQSTRIIFINDNDRRQRGVRYNHYRYDRDHRDGGRGHHWDNDRRHHR